jgi:hypothetical protein
MRNTRSCPKCRNTAILQIPGQAGGFGSGNNIPVGRSILSAVLVTRYPVRLVRLQRGVG